MIFILVYNAHESVFEVDKTARSRSESKTLWFPMRGRLIWNANIN